MISRDDWCRILTSMNTLTNLVLAEQRSIIEALLKEREQDRQFMQLMTERLQALVAEKNSASHKG